MENVKTRAVSITMPFAMYKDAEKLAKAENRTMSELLRETIRRYVAAKQDWNQFAAYGSKKAKQLGIKPSDVNRLVEEGRAEDRLN